MERFTLKYIINTEVKIFQRLKNKTLNVNKPINFIKWPTSEATD